MQKQKQRRYRFVGVLAAMMSLALGSTAAALQTTSPHYMVNETQFGAGASLNDCSSNYCAKTSAGDTVDGSGSSANYSAQFGFNTSDVPLLEVIALGGNQDLGVLDNTTTGTAVSTVKVRNYLSNGYVLQIAGAAPSQGVHTLNALTTPSTSQPGTEQFGINLAANTTPAIGLAAQQVPSSDFSFGTVTSDYNTPDLFKYTDGDIVAQSLKSTGETDYTVSMIINVSNATPGGKYTGSFSAVAVPVF